MADWTLRLIMVGSMLGGSMFFGGRVQAEKIVNGNEEKR